MPRSHWHRFSIRDLPCDKFLRITCKSCGHFIHTRDDDFIRWGWGREFVGDVEQRLTCSKCGAKGQVEIRVER